jgi:hypothetical protein
MIAIDMVNVIEINIKMIEMNFNSRNPNQDNAIIPMHKVEQEIERSLYVPVACNALVVYEQNRQVQDTPIPHNGGLLINHRKYGPLRTSLKNISNTSSQQQPYLLIFLQLKRQQME